MRGSQWRSEPGNIVPLKFWLGLGTMVQVRMFGVGCRHIGWLQDLWIYRTCNFFNKHAGVDVWAAGCTAFELATGRFLFQPKVGLALVEKKLFFHSGLSGFFEVEQGRRPFAPHHTDSWTTTHEGH